MIEQDKGSDAGLDGGDHVLAKATRGGLSGGITFEQRPEQSAKLRQWRCWDGLGSIPG